MAVLVTLPALWLESRFLVSVEAVAILIPQLLWVVDFVCAGCFGQGPLKLTAYMFDPGIPLFVRSLSLFHGWMPFLLLYLVWKLGYDRRAYLVQCICGIALFLVCYFFTPRPPAPASDPNAPANINYVFGWSDTEPQHWVPSWLWLAMLMLIFLVAFYLPTHLALSRLFGSRRPNKSAPASA